MSNGSKCGDETESDAPIQFGIYAVPLCAVLVHMCSTNVVRPLNELMKLSNFADVDCESGQMIFFICISDFDTIGDCFERRTDDDFDDIVIEPGRFSFKP